MPRRRAARPIPEPPWTYAPSEVAEWMASTAGARRPRDAFAARRVRVKGFVGECPPSTEGRLLRRLAGLGFEAAEGGRGEGLRTRLARPQTTSFKGRFGDIEVQVRLRRGPIVELRLTFRPRVSIRRASKLMSRLGLRHLEGKWT